MQLLHALAQPHTVVLEMYMLFMQVYLYRIASICIAQLLAFL